MINKAELDRVLICSLFIPSSERQTLMSLSIQSVVIEARWVKTTSLGIGIGVSLGGLPLEIGVDDLIESIDRDKRGTQRHTFYCCNDPRAEARLRGRSFRRYYESR